MTSFRTRHRVVHSASQMFDLVADVESYPEFVPLCVGLQVRTREAIPAGERLVADMAVAYGPFRETFTSRVQLDKRSPAIRVEYIDGPFRYLRNDWRFLPLPGGNCEVDFAIDYELKSLPLQMLVGTLFDKAFRKLSTAFEARADQIYGRTGSLPATTTSGLVAGR